MKKIVAITLALLVLAGCSSETRGVGLRGAASQNQQSQSDSNNLLHCKNPPLA